MPDGCGVTLVTWRHVPIVLGRNESLFWFKCSRFMLCAYPTSGERADNRLNETQQTSSLGQAKSASGSEVSWLCRKSKFRSTGNWHDK